MDTSYSQCDKHLTLLNPIMSVSPIQAWKPTLYPLVPSHELQYTTFELTNKMTCYLLSLWVSQYTSFNLLNPRLAYEITMPTLHTVYLTEARPCKIPDCKYTIKLYVKFKTLIFHQF